MEKQELIMFNFVLFFTKNTYFCKISGNNVLVFPKE